MPLDFATGMTVRIVPPVVPSILMSPPNSTVTVVPAVGPQGPPGPSGGPGGGNHRHDQIIAAAVWTITHNLGRYPSGISLHSADLSVNYAEFIVQHLSVNSLRVSMDTPTAGTALLI